MCVDGISCIYKQIRIDWLWWSDSRKFFEVLVVRNIYYFLWTCNYARLKDTKTKPYEWHEGKNKVLTLPEGEKDDWLDHEELEHWIVWNQQLTCSEVEEEECVERQTDRDVVDDCDVQVPTRHAEGNKEFNLKITQKCSKLCEKPTAERTWSLHLCTFQRPGEWRSSLPSGASPHRTAEWPEEEKHKGYEKQLLSFFSNPHIRSPLPHYLDKNKTWMLVCRTEKKKGLYLFAKPEETDGVGFTPQTAGSIHAARPKTQNRLLMSKMTN